MLRISRRPLILRTVLVLTLLLVFSLLREYHQLQDLQVRLQQQKQQPQTQDQETGDTGSRGGGKSAWDVARLWKGPSETPPSSTTPDGTGSAKDSNADGAAAPEQGSAVWDLVRRPWSWKPSPSSSNPHSDAPSGSSPSGASEHPSSTDTPSWGASKLWPWKSSSSPRNDFFDSPPLRSGAIRAVCKDTEWNSTNLVFACDGPVGGIGNIRNSILNCVRYAIHAGAAIVEPRIVLRMREDISVIRTGVTTEMSYMFETEHFYESLRESCPQMKIYRSRKDIEKESAGSEEDRTEELEEDQEKIHNELSLLPESLAGDVPGTGISNPETWRQKFYDWLDKTAPPPRSAAGPVVVSLERSYLQYPVFSDGEDFAYSFGGLLKFRHDVRVLATTILRRLVRKFSLDVTEEVLASHDAVLPHSFFGAHLRTEKDARDAWPGWTYSLYETQASLYLEQAPRSEPKFIYVASGDQAEVARFADDAAAANFTTTTSSSAASDGDDNRDVVAGWKVVTKFDVLGDDDLNTLKVLAWDQQGMVDFLVMLKASDFAGVAHSSFAWNVALKRHMMAREKEDYLDGPQMLSDDLSQVYGEPRGYPEYAACMWP